jgi:glycosyltransferase involved in cell wall biosynthesis
MSVAIIGPSERFLSGIAYYTWRMTDALEATPILYRDMLPKFLFPGKDRVGEVSSKITYENPTYLDWWNPITWFNAIKEARKHDILIVEWWSSSVAHMPFIITLFSGKPYIMEMHEISEPLEDRNLLIRLYAKLMSNIMLARADRIVVHSRENLYKIYPGKPSDALYETSEYYRKHFTGKYSVIPHGLYDQYKKYNRDYESIIFDILYFGLIRDYKGVDYLIEGYKKAYHPHKQVLHIVGENWSDTKYKDNSFPLISVIDGYQSDSDIEFWFHNADVVVLPYLRASQSGVAHIAMHYGLPIIASAVGGLLELSDYEGITYVPPADSDAIADALEQVYQNKGKRYKPPERLEWKNISSKWRDLIGEVL